MKDFQDVEGLIRINGLDVASTEIKDIFERHGTAELYQKVGRACR